MNFFAAGRMWLKIPTVISRVAEDLLDDAAIGDDRALVVVASPQVEAIIRRALHLAAALVEPDIAGGDRFAGVAVPAHVAPADDLRQQEIAVAQLPGGASCLCASFPARLRP